MKDDLIDKTIMTHDYHRLFFWLLSNIFFEKERFQVMILAAVISHPRFRRVFQSWLTILESETAAAIAKVPSWNNETVFVFWPLHTKKSLLKLHLAVVCHISVYLQINLLNLGCLKIWCHFFATFASYPDWTLSCHQGQVHKWGSWPLGWQENQ